MSMRDEAERAGLGDYVFDVDADAEPRLRRRPDPEQSSDALIAQLREFDAETEQVLDAMRQRRAAQRQQLEQRAAEALRRENEGTSNATDTPPNPSQD